MAIERLGEEAVARLNMMCPGAYSGQLGTVVDALIEFMLLVKTPKTPVNGVAATGKVTVTSGQNVSDGDKLTVGDIEYTFRGTFTSDPDTVPNEIKIGADANGTAANIVLAIAAAGGAEIGTNYSTGTLPHPLVNASAADNVVTFTAKKKGAGGNDTALAKEGTNLTVTGVKLGTGGGTTEGVDGTVGKKGDICFDDTYIYRCKDDNTTADANWVKLGSFSA